MKRNLLIVGSQLLINFNNHTVVGFGFQGASQTLTETTGLDTKVTGLQVLEILSNRYHSIK